MAFNYSKLRGKIKEVCGTHELFAKAIKTTPVSLSKKLNRGVSFSQTEIADAIKVLNLTAEDIPVYFFTQKVQKN